MGVGVGDGDGDGEGDGDGDGEGDGDGDGEGDGDGDGEGDGIPKNAYAPTAMITTTAIPMRTFLSIDSPSFVTIVNPF